MKRHTNHRRAALGALVISAVVLAACGGDDDDAASSDAAPASEGAATSDAATSSDEGADTSASDAASDSSDGPTIVVDDINDMPQACIDVMTEFLQTIEPVVKDVDWKTATLNDFEQINTTLSEQFTDFDTRTAAAGCEQYDFSSDEASLAAVTELANDKAPGAVGWLEFLGNLTAEMSADAADVPADCDGAISYIEGLMADAPNMRDLPVSQMSAAGQAMGVVQSECSAEKTAAFFARTDISAFLASA